MVPDGNRASLTGHAALGEASEWNGYTRDPLLSPLSTAHICPSGPSMPGTMSDVSRFASLSSAEPSPVVPQGDKGASLIGHSVLGKGAVRNESTRGPMVCTPSSDYCVLPGASVPETMSDTIRGSSRGLPEPFLVVPDVVKCTSLTGHAALGESFMGNESIRNPGASPPSGDDCVPRGAIMPGTMLGTIRGHWDKPPHGWVSEALGQHLGLPASCLACP